jgi:hypothetical protein
MKEDTKKELETIGNIVALLNRVQIQGLEVPVYTECIQWLQSQAQAINMSTEGEIE